MLVAWTVSRRGCRLRWFAVGAHPSHLAFPERSTHFVCVVLYSRFALEDAALEKATGLPTLADVQWYVRHLLPALDGAGWVSDWCPTVPPSIVVCGLQASRCGASVVALSEGDGTDSGDAGRRRLSMGSVHCWGCACLTSAVVVRHHRAAQMTLSDGNIKTFEVPIDKFNELRYNVAKVCRVNVYRLGFVRLVRGLPT